MEGEAATHKRKGVIIPTQVMLMHLCTHPQSQTGFNLSSAAITSNKIAFVKGMETLRKTKLFEGGHVIIIVQYTYYTFEHEHALGSFL